MAVHCQYHRSGGGHTQAQRLGCLRGCVRGRLHHCRKAGKGHAGDDQRTRNTPQCSGTWTLSQQDRWPGPQCRMDRTPTHLERGRYKSGNDHGEAGQHPSLAEEDRKEPSHLSRRGTITGRTYPIPCVNHGPAPWPVNGDTQRHVCGNRPRRGPHPTTVSGQEAGPLPGPGTCESWVHPHQPAAPRR